MELRSYAKVLAVVCLALTLREASAEKLLAPATIVVFNKDVPESVELAKFYAQKRGIDHDHLVGLTCSKAEEISRDEYDVTIRDPLRAIFSQKKWWTLHEVQGGQTTIASNSIRFVALIKGMPLKIKHMADYPGDKPSSGPVAGNNAAAVDSELAALGNFSPQISGALPNPYFQSYRAITEFENSALMLVCRLDAPTAATVRRMIVDAIEAEKTGLWGRAYIDGAHNTDPGLKMGDDWLAEIAGQLHKVGVPVISDDAPAIFPDGYPMTDCALYFGWYAQTMAGPFTQPGFQFAPGAIAVHIHSFSARTLKYDNANWAGPLLAKGATATLGNVYEPFLQFTSHLSVFSDRLLHGFTFAESAYMSVPALSWMNVMVGDPLYRPYAAWLRIAEGSDSEKAVSDWKSYHEFATKNSSRPPTEFRALARQLALRGHNGPMLEDLGLVEIRDGNLAAATSYFQQARSVYAKRDDILRVVLEEGDAWIRQNKSKRAVDLIRSVLRISGDAPSAPLLKKLEMEARATPATTPANVRRP
ncbi:MAG: hypothetical protein DLM73_07735 [Chthoniobacterales bacterium]|nr:MAG: hypothetical protein DLM73_07735 [Chthoniobacterales bacterium]